MISKIKASRLISAQKEFYTNKIHIHKNRIQTSKEVKYSSLMNI